MRKRGKYCNHVIGGKKLKQNCIGGRGGNKSESDDDEKVMSKWKW